MHMGIHIYASVCVCVLMSLAHCWWWFWIFLQYGEISWFVVVYFLFFISATDVIFLSSSFWATATLILFLFFWGTFFVCRNLGNNAKGNIHQINIKFYIFYQCRPHDFSLISSTCLCIAKGNIKCFSLALFFNRDTDVLIV